MKGEAVAEGWKAITSKINERGVDGGVPASNAAPVAAADGWKVVAAKINAQASRR